MIYQIFNKEFCDKTGTKSGCILLIGVEVNCIILSDVFEESEINRNCEVEDVWIGPSIVPIYNFFRVPAMLKIK